MNLNSFFSKIASSYDSLIDLVSIGAEKKFVREVLRELGKDNKRKKVLDVATGTGRIALAIAGKYNNCKVVGIDINEDMLKEAFKKIKGRENVKFILKSVESLNFRDAEFDVIISALSLNLFENLGDAMGEMHRVLKPGGKLMLFDMLKPKDSVLKKLLNIYYSTSVVPVLDVRLRQEMKYFIRKTFEVDENQVIAKLVELGYNNIKEKKLSEIAFMITAIK
ncbi:MAG: class I SAM-dependent methyltransferase [Candidatus Micrarchaeia archaeon]